MSAALPEPTPAVADPTPDPTPTSEPAAADPTPGFEPITSQEEFDKRIQGRLARVKATPPADYETLKARAAQLTEIEEAQKTELQKANDRAAAAEKNASEAALRAQENSLRAAVIAEAAKRKVHDPDAALALLDRTALEYGDDGSPTNVAEAMEALLTAKPYLAGTTTTPSADLGARGTAAGAQLKQEDLKSMTPDQIVAAQSQGRLNTLLGITKA